MDSVFVRDLTLRGTHGVHEREWSEPQEFVVDVEAKLDVSKSIQSDDLDDTVCWTLLAGEVKKVIEGPTIHLIERIAATIAQNILKADARIERVSVTVRKTEVSVDGVPGVTITRTR